MFRIPSNAGRVPLACTISILTSSLEKKIDWMPLLCLQVSRLTTELEEEVAKQQKNSASDESSVLNSSLDVQQQQSTGKSLNLLNNATVTVSVDNEAATTTSLIPTAAATVVTKETEGAATTTAIALPSGDGKVGHSTHVVATFKWDETAANQRVCLVKSFQELRNEPPPT